MYAETGLMFPCFHNFNEEVQQIDEFCSSQKHSAPLDVPTPLMPEYNLWGEGDLFKAPEPIIEEEQVTGLDPISMISCREDLLSDVFYECKKDLLAKEGNSVEETPLSEALVSILKTPNLRTDENKISDEKLILEGPFPKSVSSTCLSSLGHQTRPSFLDFPAADFGSVYGMRRAFSEGDIKTTFGNDNNNNSLVQSGTRRTNITSAEDRREKLSRYRNKKAKRNFARKIKYACRKALADSQPRIRGRFAKNNEETQISKKL